MTVLNEILCKRRNRLIISALFNILLIILYMYLYSPSYETNDDSGIISIASGIKGFQDAHVIYSHYYLGKLYVLLFSVVPEIPWVCVIQYVVLFLAFTSITSVLLGRLGSSAYILMVFALVAAFGYEGYVHIQFTKTAAFAMTAGLVIIMGELFAEKISPIVMIPGLLIFWIGFMYRNQQFIVMIAILSSLVLYFFMILPELGGRDRRKCLKRAGAAILAAGILFAGTAGLFLTDRIHYTSDEWVSFGEYNAARTEILDYGIPDFDENRDRYEEVGIDKTAYSLLKHWNFQDKKKFTTSTFQTIASWKEKPKVDKGFVKTYLKELFSGLKKKKVFWIFGIVAFGWIICGRHRIRELLTLAYCAAMILALYGYLFYMNRFLVHRVDVGIWFAAIIVVIWLYRRSVPLRGAIVGLVLAITVTFCTVTSWSDWWRVNTADSETKTKTEREFIEMIHQDQDHLYLSTVGNVSFHKAYGLFEQAPFGMGSNIFGLGGWPAQTPAYQSVLERYDIDNPYPEMIDNKDVYLVDDDIDSTLNYLRRWYDKNASAKLIRKVGDHRIYQITTEKKDDQ